MKKQKLRRVLRKQFRNLLLHNYFLDFFLPVIYYIIWFGGFFSRQQNVVCGKGTEKTIRTIPTEEYFARVRQQLSENGQAFVRVTGSSMQPLLFHLRDGVAIVPPGEIHIGDIVLYDRQNGRYALHRVIRKGKEGFTMAGDNQWHMENDLPYDQIVGVVSRIQRNGKWIPCTNALLRLYSCMVSVLAFPRINLWKVVVRLGKLIKHSGNKDQEGVL